MMRGNAYVCTKKFFLQKENTTFISGIMMVFLRYVAQKNPVNLLFDLKLFAVYLTSETAVYNNHVKKIKIKILKQDTR